MEIIKAVPDGVRAVVFTVDGTLQRCDAYLKEGQQKVVAELAKPFMLPPDKVERVVAQRKEDLEAQKGREVAFSEVVQTLSIADLQWQNICERSYCPEAYFRDDRELRRLLKDALEQVVPSLRVIAAGMLTRNLAARTLGVLGLTKTPFFGRRIWGPEKGGNPAEEAYWRDLAVHFGFAPATIVVVGSSHVTDVVGPHAAGYGGVILVEGPHELQRAISLLRLSRRGGE